MELTTVLLFLLLVSLFVSFVGMRLYETSGTEISLAPPIFFAFLLLLDQRTVVENRLFVSSLIVSIPIWLACFLLIIGRYRDSTRLDAFLATWRKDIEQIDYRYKLSSHILSISGFSLTVLAVLIAINPNGDIGRFGAPLTLLLSSSVLLLVAAQVVRSASFLGPLFLGETLYLAGCFVMIVSLYWLFVLYGLGGTIPMNVSIGALVIITVYLLYRSWRTFITIARQNAGT